MADDLHIRAWDAGARAGARLAVEVEQTVAVLGADALAPYSRAFLRSFVRAYRRRILLAVAEYEDGHGTDD